MAVSARCRLPTLARPAQLHAVPHSGSHTREQGPALPPARTANTAFPLNPARAASGGPGRPRPGPHGSPAGGPSAARAPSAPPPAAPLTSVAAGGGVAGGEQQDGAQRQRLGGPHAEVIVDLPLAQGVGQARHLGSSMTTVRGGAGGRAQRGSTGSPQAAEAAPAAGCHRPHRRGGEQPGPPPPGRSCHLPPPPRSPPSRAAGRCSAGLFVEHRNIWLLFQPPSRLSVSQESHLPEDLRLIASDSSYLTMR